MKSKLAAGIVLIAFVLSAAGFSGVSAADTLTASDFDLESWDKTIDFFEYARDYAAAHGLTAPPSDWKAYTYVTYVNIADVRVLYCGLLNLSFGFTALTIPKQMFLMSYKTENESIDAVAASSFVMLMAFNETEDTLYSDSPDLNDTLYASFNRGYDLTSLFEGSAPPALSSKTTVTPLTSSANNLHWSWGMRYTNLTALWWRTYISPDNPRYLIWPVAYSRYDELTFTYDLSIDPDTHRITLREDHVIGNMHDLWIFDWFHILFPHHKHYNGTGCYGMLGNKISNETVYQYINNHGIKMSIILYQKSLLLNRSTRSTSGAGQNVTDRDVIVSDSSVSTTSEDGEKVFDVSFDTKKTYRLFNLTAGVPETHDAVTRTSKIRGFAFNPVFKNSTAFTQYVSLLVAHLAPSLYEQAKTYLFNMTGADYFYIISYPTYGGYKINHDPTYTAYYSTAAEEEGLIFGGKIGKVVIVLVIMIIVITIIIIAVYALRRKPK